MIKFNLIFSLIVITLEIIGLFFTKEIMQLVCVLYDSYKNNAPSKIII